MRDNDAESDKGGVKLLEVYALANDIEENDEKRPIKAHDFINEQANNSYFRQASYALGSPRSMYNSNRQQLLTRVAPIDREEQKVIHTLVLHCCYISHTTQHWGNTRVRDVCTT